MMNHLKVMDIQDSFILENRGIVVVGNVSETWILEKRLPISKMSPVFIQRQDGARLEAVVCDIDVFTPPLAARDEPSQQFRTVGVLLFGIAEVESILKGSSLLTSNLRHF